MKNVMVILFLFSLVMFTQPAFAAPATSTLSWTPPVTRVDGTPFTVEEISEYRIYHAIDGPVEQGADYDTANDFQTREIITLELAPRAEPYVVSFAVSTVDTDGLESALSETASKTFDVGSTAKPGAPTSITFSITCGDGCTIEGL